MLNESMCGLRPSSTVRFILQGSDMIRRYPSIRNQRSIRKNVLFDNNVLTLRHLNAQSPSVSAVTIILGQNQLYDWINWSQFKKET